MRAVVCLRQGKDGLLGPFDAAAYEAALRTGCEVILLSMGAPSTGEYLTELTRLGAAGAVLLCDPLFAGADTLATARTLALAVKKLAPDLIFCGRQTMIGDTGQTGPMLAALLGWSLSAGVMQVGACDGTRLSCITREGGETTVALPALLTVERIHTLRLPRLGSRVTACRVWDAAALGADAAECGLAGSPTRVLETFPNASGRRKCTKISMAELDRAIEEGLSREKDRLPPGKEIPRDPPRILCVGNVPAALARTVSDRVRILPAADTAALAAAVEEFDPAAVLFGSDSAGKCLAAEFAVHKGLGLCADCTALGFEENTFLMYRPALSGSLIAKIKSLTRPALATVRGEGGKGADILFTLGYGARESMEKARALAAKYGAALGATRRMVDEGYLPYELQVGLTGRTVSPPVYVAIGVSGAVHHIVGMECAGTVIAVNPDPDAPIFEYADFGITENF